ncbi:hypothetical protein BDV33DRAFT_169270 [Aspergillus novoparasiticus]|uniref:Uncharacterized protein n=1 Tax=Aspergillus novoparasiticus TaxID=986946 RepID=A0A5N6EWY8_9EURO|nr:hypothetical protein BDV33DRAFT_169270 [Aspergillus novoparasiticus]
MEKGKEKENLAISQQSPTLGLCLSHIIGCRLISSGGGMTRKKPVQRLIVMRLMSTPY